MSDAQFQDGESAYAERGRAGSLAEDSSHASNLVTPNPRVRYVIDRKRLRKWYVISLVLFLATCLSTFLTHAGPTTDGVLRSPMAGLEYMAAVMAILLAHELGHFLQTLRYGVPATPPFFIPMPFGPLGTMGAVILQGAGFANRKATFDIAISGPLAGLVVAFPIAWLGLQSSEVQVIASGQPGIIFGDPLVLQWMYELHFGPLEPNEQVTRTPLLFAGWVGFFITGLNLLPVGQLDGGHIVYTLLGRRAHYVAFGTLAIAAVFMIVTYDIAYLLFLMLILKMGARHPPTADDSVKLGPGRVVLGWLTMAFLVIGFTPHPIMQIETGPPSASARQTSVDASGFPSR